MNGSKLARRLGYSSADRLLVIHADDVGMCSATIDAVAPLFAHGAITSASTMVPCGWFPAAAAWCRANADVADMGVHLTLNSEWDAYRWGPITGLAARTLQDRAGYFPHWPNETYAQCDPEEVYLELRAQIDRALAHGIDLTHIDSHMYALRHPALVEVYLRLSREYQLPCGVVRAPDPELENVLRLPKAQLEDYYRQIDAAEAEGLAVFDEWVCLSLDIDPTLRLDAAKQLLDRLPEGVSTLLSHPAVDSPELRSAAPDWASRAANLELLLSDGWAKALDASGVKVIGMREIRDAVREHGQRDVAA